AAIADEDIATRDFGSDALRLAIIEFASHFAVYRTYLDSNGPSTTDGEILETVALRAKVSRRIEDPNSVDFLVSLLSGRVPTAQKAQAEAFTTRFQQTTGPLMAKAVEDTEFYRFNRLIALNEVGGEPDAVSPGAEQFHTAMARRQMLAPRALSATATHDTKRGEDARVRLYALSTIQDEWCEAVERWSAKLSGPSSEAGQDAPDREAQWLFFQALAGAWPTDETASDDLDDRMVQFMIKASREAKLFSSWTNPDPSYETRIASFVQYALDPANGFVDDFKHMIEPLIKAGAATSLVQTVLKVFAPGVPDIYQGTELWDLSLVDPDNRRPVDFEHRQRLISNAPQELLVDEAAWRDGSLKLDLLRRSLAVRRQMDFTKATYEPLQMTGGDSERAFAFARRARDRTVIVIGARASPKDYQGITGFGFDNAPWHGTQIAVPPDLKNHHFVDVFSGTTVPVNDQTIEVAAALRCLPVAVLSSAS
ncbi:MAG: malto-oligosyltrehalose synthase, partial [Hyphomicrobium sp.]